MLRMDDYYFCQRRILEGERNPTAKARVHSSGFTARFAKTFYVTRLAM
jgi:hypothetical protein